MDFRQQITVLRRSWALIAAVLVVAIGGTAIWTMLQVPQYSAAAEAFVSTRGSGNLQDLSTGGTYAQQVVKSYAEVATRPIVLDTVRRDLRLSATSVQLSRQVSASVDPDTVVIQIQAVSTSPKEAADIANAVMAGLQRAVPVLSPSDDSRAQVTLTRIAPATADQDPTSPDTARNLLLGTMLGAAIAVGLAFARAGLDNKLRTAGDVAALTNKPLLGNVPFDLLAAARPLTVGADAGEARAEAHKLLRTNLQYLEPGGGPRVLTVTSAVEQEGKSTIAANLAIVTAEAEPSVVLVDADLRRPRLAEYFGLDGSTGLTEVLIGTHGIEEVLVPWGEQGLQVLPAGSIPPNPSELLQSDAMHTLLATLSARFTTVIVDSPPLLPVPDATLLSKMTRGAIVVAAAGRVRKLQLQAALEALTKVDARILGVVVTMTPTRGPDGAGYRGYPSANLASANAGSRLDVLRARVKRTREA